MSRSASKGLFRKGVSWRKINGGTRLGQQDRESPIGNPSSERVSESTSENIQEVPFCDLVFISNVSLRGLRRSLSLEDFLSETLGPIAHNRVARSTLSKFRALFKG